MARSSVTSVAVPLGVLVLVLVVVGVVGVVGGGPWSGGGAPREGRPQAGSTASPGPAVPSAPGGSVADLPTTRTAGVPPGWRPRRSVQGTVTVTTPGALVSDLRITGGNLVVAAPGVTVRRVEIRGGVIDNFTGPTCSAGLTVVQTTLRRARGQVTAGDTPAIGVGGYTADRVEILGLPEGFRVGAADACGPVVITDSYVEVTSPDVCGDWHGDALQGYDGGDLTLRDSVLLLRVRDGCSGTAPFFYPSGQGNGTVDVDGLLVAGGGFPFRLGTEGSVTGLAVVGGSGVFGPLDVACSALSGWDAELVRRDGAGYVPVRPLPCDTEGGS